MASVQFQFTAGSTGTTNGYTGYSTTYIQVGPGYDSADYKARLKMDLSSFDQTNKNITGVYLDMRHTSTAATSTTTVGTQMIDIILSTTASYEGSLTEALEHDNTKQYIRGVTSALRSGSSVWYRWDITEMFDNLMLYPTHYLKLWGRDQTSSGLSHQYQGIDSDNPPVIVIYYEETTDVPVTGISVTPTSATITEGNTTTLTATITPSNASNQTVNWTSSDSGVATVSNGVVTGISEGSCTITATSAYSSDIYATCAITVNKATTTTEISTKEYFSAGTSGIGSYTGYNSYINVGYGHDTGAYKGRLRLNLTGDYSGKNITSIRLYLAHTSTGGTSFKNSAQGLSIAADNSGTYVENYTSTMSGALGYVEDVVSAKLSTSSYWYFWDITDLKDVLIANPTCYLKLWDMGTITGAEELPCQYHSTNSTNYAPYLLITYEAEQDFNVVPDSDYYETKEEGSFIVSYTATNEIANVSHSSDIPLDITDISISGTTCQISYTANNTLGNHLCSVTFEDSSGNTSTTSFSANILPRGTIYYPQDGVYREYIVYYPINGVWTRCQLRFGQNAEWIEND